MKVIRDATFGFGIQFWVCDATVTGKMIHYDRMSSHRKSHERVCLATPELEAEVKKFMEARDKLGEWGAKIKDMIEAGEQV